MHTKPPRDASDNGPPDRVDADGRDVAIEPQHPARFESLVAMYDDFAPAQRAQGLPPTDTSRIREWLENLTAGTNLVAVHDDAVVGHLTFVPDGDGAHELGVFVHQDYQDAGIGTTLLRAGFEHARRTGIDDVWLTVDRSNPAADLYRRLGFTEDATHCRSVRMSRSLTD